MPFAGDPLLDTDQVLAQIRARKAADETVNNSATLQTDDALSVPFQPGHSYEVHLFLIVNSPTAADFKWRFVETSAGGVTGRFRCITVIAGGALTDVSGTTATVFTSEGAAADKVIEVWGELSVGVNPGSLKIEWAQNTATVADTVVKSSSYLRLLEIA